MRYLRTSATSIFCHMMAPNFGSRLKLLSHDILVLNLCRAWFPVCFCTVILPS
jgi:hypothetical protein